MKQVRKGNVRVPGIRRVWFAAVLTLAACFLSVFLSYAEEAEEVDTTYVIYLEHSVDAAAQMVSKAVQEEVFLTGWDFRELEYASPATALLVFPTDEQHAQLVGTFGTADRSSLVSAIAKAINSQFSDEYANLADSLLMKGDFKTLPEDSPALVMALLFYNRHICLTLMDQNGWSSVFLMSDETVLPTVNESYIPERISQMGVTGDIEQVMYDAETLDAIFEKKGYRSNIDPVIEAVTASEDTFRRMAAEMIAGCAYKYNSYLSPDKLIVSYGEDHAEEYTSEYDEIIAVRALAEETFAETEDWTWKGFTLDTKAYPGFTASEEPAVYQADKTMLVINRDAGEETGEIDYTLESVLPVQNLPSSDEDADLIILVESDWQYDGMNNGIKVYLCKTVISLYDAATQEKLGMIGTSFNQLSGFVMVNGDSYYPSVNKADVKQVLLNWVATASGGEEAEASSEAAD